MSCSHCDFPLPAFVERNNTHAATIAVATTVKTCVVISIFTRKQASGISAVLHLHFTYQLSTRAALYQSLPSRVPAHRLYIVVKPGCEASDGKDPKYKTEG